MLKPSNVTQVLQQSGIRAASVYCASVNGINLGQGICDLPTPSVIIEALTKALYENKNTYSACEGIMPLRIAVAEKLAKFNLIEANPANEIIITHGSTGAFICAIKTLFNPGDEIILFEPFYGYHKNILDLHGMPIKTVLMDSSTFAIDFDYLRSIITAKTKGIVICTPCNPNGKIFSREELLTIGQIAKQYDLRVITDEIYEYITYPGYEHISLASLEDFKERTVTISGFSKTYNMTGWRLGYAVGPAEIIAKMALVQDLLYVCPATPLQYAVCAAFSLPDSYYVNMQQQYLKHRDQVLSALKQMNFQITAPQGAYYVMADCSALGFSDDQEAASFILKEAKVACVPGRAFYLDPKQGKHMLRICYALNEERLRQAMQQMQSAFSKSH